uniref:Glabrous enhancer-binding protein-like DBD domain-containing protein n=1 Tax=Leersia perrieri TaxID=77586 RepID=A0A0D9WN51_9ORYZ
MEGADAAVAPLHPSSPRSKKRSSASASASASSSRRRPTTSRRRPTANPSLGVVYASASRHSERKRKPVALAAHGSGSGGAVQKLWTGADEVALLAGAVAFRRKHGYAPRLPDMGALYKSIRRSISSHIDKDKVYYKLKRVKSRFQHATPRPNANPHEIQVRVLCEELWGGELAAPVADREAGEGRDAYVGRDLDFAARLPVVSDVLGEYWRKNGRVLSGLSLKKGLARVGPEEGREVETKWRQQLEAETQIQGQRHELAKEVCAMLMDAVRGLGP